MSNITKHAEKRIRKRLGINKRSAEANYASALKHGKRAKDFKGAFRKYLDFWQKDYFSTAIVYDYAIYFVKHGDLVTVWPVPAKFRKYIKADRG